MKFAYINAPAGAGKTYSLVDKAAGLVAQGDRVLFVMISRRLITETVTSELARHPTIHRSVIVTVDEQKDSVTSQIVKKLSQPSARGEILFITHEGLRRLPYPDLLRGWHVLIDEALQVHKPLQVTADVPTLALLAVTERLPGEVAGYETLSPVSRAVIERARSQENDAAIRGFADGLLSKNWTVYSPEKERQQWDAPEASGKELTIFAYLRPSMLKKAVSVTMAAANFADTLTFKLWSCRGVRFVEDKATPLRFRSHENGEHLTIYYAHDGDWSKYLGNKKIDGTDETVFERLLTTAAELFGGERFLWTANEDRPGDLFSACPGAERISTVSHGLNSYSDYDNLVFLSALNPTSAGFRYLQACGLSAEEVKTAFYREAVYQTVLRTSLRDPDCQRPRKIMVPDRATADRLAGHLPGASLESLDCIPPSVGMKRKPGPVAKYSSTAERVRACRLRRRNKKDLVSGLEKTLDHGLDRYELSLIDYRDLVTGFYGMQFSSLHALAHDRLVSFDSVEEFTAGIKELWERPFIPKEDNFLIAPAFFDPAKSSDTDRGLENIEFLRGIWLDNDGGDLSPSGFASLFPTMRMAIWNSSSSRAAVPRWRVFIPTTTVLTVDVYNAFMAYLFMKMEQAGYFKQCEGGPEGSRKDGFDRSKLHAASLFYAPCQAADPGGSFFEEFKHGREVLDPRKWIDDHVNEVLLAGDIPEAPERVTERNEALVQSALDWWASCGGEPNHGNQRFFVLGLRLASAGLPEHELVTMLTAEAGSANTPAKRVKQVFSVAGSLKKIGKL